MKIVNSLEIEKRDLKIKFMFFSQKKFFSFLLLVNLLFTNSFILAYEMPGDVWNFTTRDGPKGTDLKIESKTYCAPAPAGQGIIGFKWTYKDEGEKNQTGYDFRVNDINNVNAPNPEIYRQVRELNNPSDTINTQSVMVKYPLETDKITFNKLYYWWVKVYNTEGGDSGWINGRYFNTPIHAYPYPDFVVSPTKPVINKPVEFKQDSAETGATCYQTEGAEILCQNSASAGYKWDFIYNTGIDSATKGNATTSYNATGTYETMLEITDNVGACAAFKSFEVKDKNASSFSLPRWKEISP